MMRPIGTTIAMMTMIIVGRPSDKDSEEGEGLDFGIVVVIVGLRFRS